MSQLHDVSSTDSESSESDAESAETSDESESESHNMGSVSEFVDVHASGTIHREFSSNKKRCLCTL